MSKAEVLEQIQQARAALLTAIEGLSDDVLLRPYVVGLWSIKDALAHLTTWESEVVTALASLNPAHAPHVIDIEDIDEYNEEHYRVNVRRPLDVILEDFHGVHKHLLKAVEALDDRTLDDGRRFAWMEGEPLWYLIAENAYWHEQEHAEDIQRWREENEL
ncbi:MAG: DinB family protein [Aggregatilineales bacterium]